MYYDCERDSGSKAEGQRKHEPDALCREVSSAVGTSSHSPCARHLVTVSLLPLILSLMTAFQGHYYFPTTLKRSALKIRKDWQFAQSSHSEELEPRCPQGVPRVSTQSCQGSISSLTMTGKKPVHCLLWGDVERVSLCIFPDLRFPFSSFSFC